MSDDKIKHDDKGGNSEKSQEELRAERARRIAEAGGIKRAIATGALSSVFDASLSEILILGLLRQDVRKFIGIFGHGSTEIGEVMRVYEDAGLLKMYNIRHETAASHAAAALRWVTGEKAAVVTSIGPGAMHALAGSLLPASDGLGVWYLFGDETTEDEGPNMQQIPKPEQDLFLKLCSVMGSAYSLHTARSVSTALRRGLTAVDHPHRAGPFYLLMPMNRQPEYIRRFNIRELPSGIPPRLGAASAENGVYVKAIEALNKAERVVVKVGGGARDAGKEIEEFLGRVDGVAVLSPLVLGVIPYDHPRNMLVGGSKGTICGNYAMEEADLLVAVGTRFVCQSDCSRTGYPKVKHVININADYHSAVHYGDSTVLVGDAAQTLAKLNDFMTGIGKTKSQKRSNWFEECLEQRKKWEEFKKERYENPTLYDEGRGTDVLTQPAVIKTALDWARRNDAVSFFDAGDVQANGFQVAEDDRLGRTFTDTGASYMGFAVSALMASAMASDSFYGLALTGDGSFTMNPQILIDGVQHGVEGCILLLDNRSMAAISALQKDQYGSVYVTKDEVEVDYIGWAKSIRGVAAFPGGNSLKSLNEALKQAKAHKGISLIHVPVYCGDDPLGGLGAFGRWNVGNWVDATQALRHEIGL